MEKSRRQRGEDVINSHILWAMGAGAIPLPMLDIAAVTLIKLDMIKQLCHIYEIDYSEESGKGIITSLAGSTLAKIGASFLKAVPIIGGVLGSLSMGVISGASTFAIGQVFLNQFEQGKGISDFDTDSLRTFYEEQFEKGKSYVEWLKKQTGLGEDASKQSSKRENPTTKPYSNPSATPAGSGSSSNPTADVIGEKLRILADLKSKGILSEEEYNQKRAQLLSQI
ncbi:DUF697 domain-containing protein [Eisenibacter elegans]|uniref:DUF697 domain-containing protein n=1 Tax=Eisenibacter elegans TaxID=997 RepID=UPI00042696CF|nr:DUF697 domain-containing protein [Eisenibacter elegans]